MDEFTARQLIRLGHIERMVRDLFNQDEPDLFSRDWLAYRKHSPTMCTCEETLAMCAAIEATKSRLWALYEVATNEKLIDRTD
jgi:hypothetical protein